MHSVVVVHADLQQLFEPSVLRTSSVLFECCFLCTCWRLKNNKSFVLPAGIMAKPWHPRVQPFNLVHLFVKAKVVVSTSKYWVICFIYVDGMCARITWTQQSKVLHRCMCVVLSKTCCRHEDLPVTRSNAVTAAASAVHAPPKRQKWR